MRLIMDGLRCEHGKPSTLMMTTVCYNANCPDCIKAGFKEGLEKQLQKFPSEATLPQRECTEAEMQDHVIQLAALGMCCIGKPLWEGRAAIEEYLRRHFIPRRQDVSSNRFDEDGAHAPKITRLQQ